MEYQIVYDRKVHALRADFDEEYEKVSPGSFLNRRLVEQLFEIGCTRYYMGPGKNSYKTRWSTTGEPLQTLVAYSPTLRGQALSFWPHDVKPRLRKLRDRLTPVVAVCACFWSKLSETALVGLVG
jgi:CelD/BcsL family acetyltransferase involved in cellulose biosynthesis